MIQYATFKVYIPVNTFIIYKVLIDYICVWRHIHYILNSICNWFAIGWFSLT